MSAHTDLVENPVSLNRAYNHSKITIFLKETFFCFEFTMIFFSKPNVLFHEEAIESLYLRNSSICPY